MLTLKKEFLILSLLPFTYSFPVTHDFGTVPINQVFNGDIRLPLNYNQKSGIIDPAYRWPEGLIPFEIDSTFSPFEVGVILASMAEISEKTCIKFQWRTTEEDYVRVQRDPASSGCWAYLGRNGGLQLLNLDTYCVTTQIIGHEFIHAIGFFHEQSRTDRDDFVTINWENIMPEFLENFEKYGSDFVDPFGTPYEYGSIMHYHHNACAIDPNIPTIIPKEDAELFGAVITELDALKINNMYHDYCVNQ